MKNKLVLTFTMFGLCFFLLGFLSKYHWLLELFANLRVYFLFYFIITAFISLWTKHKWLLGLNLGLSLCILLSIKPYFEKQHHEGGSDRLKLISANVLSSNSNYESLIEFITEENPDVIYLMEVTSNWLANLKVLEHNYPYFHAVTREDNFGIAIYSKFELLNLKVIGEPINKIPSYVTDIRSKNKVYHFIGIHPLPPIGQEYFVLRNQQLRRVNKIATEYEENLIVMGDFNCSAFSANFSRLTEHTNLKDTRNGFGLQGSWTSKSNLLSFAIDHCLVSENIKVLDRRIGKSIESDHYPVIVEVN